MTIYWYDTEFIERGPGEPIDLISLGMIAENGAELYVELDDAPWEEIHAHPWLAANVVPHLSGGEDPDTCMDRASAREKLVAFWRTNGWPTQLWAYFSAYDHVMLSQIFGRMIDLPENVPMFSYDLKVAMQHLSVPPQAMPKQDGAVHNALEDARWVKRGWEFLRELEGKST